jgi:pimeloyl-ACP methyl ester carboxylesterase
MLLALALTQQPSLSAASAASTIIPTKSKLFEFHSAFWTNLHHFLYVQARARLKTSDSNRVAVTAAKKDLENIARLEPEQRRIWEAALDYYEQQVAKHDLVFDDALIATTNKIAAAESAATLASSGLDPALIKVLESAAGVYRVVWWLRHDEGNRVWVAAMDALLQKHGNNLALQVTKALQTKWPATPFRVDVCAYANWAGAYTGIDPTRVTISSTDPVLKTSLGLETLFHEPLHALEEPLDAALRRESLAQGKLLPRVFSHTIIFYTAGEYTRRAIPSHVPYAVSEGLWEGSPWSEFKKVLDTHWLPYLDGQINFDESLKRLVSTFANIQRNGAQDVDAGGHKVHMVVQGNANPTVVLESGLGQGREAWTRVFLDVANFARVVTYDRAGLGLSEPGPPPRTAEQMATELHTALKNAGLAPPYVLVGHSGSGFTVRVFAHLYPKEVVGLVLVDPTQEGLTDWIKAHHPDVWQRLEDEQKKNTEGIRNELTAAAESEKQAHAAVPLPEVPVVLLTGMGTDSFRTPDLLAVWLSLHNEWLKTIPHNKHVLAQHSEHFIQTSEPELVIQAIQEIVDAARRTPRRS